MVSGKIPPAGVSRYAVPAVPQSLESEKSIIGGLLQSPDAYDRIDWLRATAFYHLDHRLIYSAIRDLIEAGKPVDALFVAEELIRRGELENVGGQAYLGSLVTNIPSAANIKRYAEMVRDRAILRELQAHAADIQARAAEPGVDPRELAEEAEARIFDLVQERDDSRAQPFRHVLDATLTRRQQPQRGLATGFVDLDTILKGLRPGELIVVAGRPSMGKSALITCIAEHVARREPVALYSLEMAREDIGERILTWHEREREQDAAAKHLIDLKLYIDTPSTLTIGGLRMRLRRQKRKYGLSLAVIDYLQLMRGQGENRTQEIGSISRGLKQLAMEFEIPVVAACQINRGVENRQDRRPLLSDLRESGDIEQDADVVVMLYRDDYYHPESPAKGTAEADVKKHRNGRTGMARLTFLAEYARFQNYAGPPIPEKPSRSPSVRRTGTVSTVDFKSAASGRDD